VKFAGRPRVIVNFAMTVDGKVSTRKFTPTGFTGSADKRRLRGIRALGDALLVGAATVAADSMAMGLSDGGLQKARIRRGQAPEPLRVLLTNSGKLNLKWKVFANSRTPLVIFAGRRISSATRNSLPDFCDLWVFERETVSMASVLEILAEDYGIRTLVCEGGPRVFRSLASEGAVDELFLTIAPRIFAGSTAPTLTGNPSDFLPKGLQLRLISGRVVQDEWHGHYSIAKKNMRCVVFD